MTQLGHILSIHEPLDQSGMTGGGLDPYNVHALLKKHGQHVDGKIW